MDSGIVEASTPTHRCLRKHSASRSVTSSPGHRVTFNDDPPTEHFLDHQLPQFNTQPLSKIFDDDITSGRVIVKRSASTLSHDNPFLSDTELCRKAEYIVRHSNFSRKAVFVVDPDCSEAAAEDRPTHRTMTDELLSNGIGFSTLDCADVTSDCAVLKDAGCELMNGSGQRGINDRQRVVTIDSCKQTEDCLLLQSTVTRANRHSVDDVTDDVYQSSVSIDPDEHRTADGVNIAEQTREDENAVKDTDSEYKLDKTSADNEYLCVIVDRSSSICSLTRRTSSVVAKNSDYQLITLKQPRRKCCLLQ